MPRHRRAVLSSLALVALAAAPAGGAGTLFLDRCVGNCTYMQGFDNSCNNTSSLISGTRQLSPYAGTDDDWSELLACVRSVLDPFDVTITDVNPGCATHWEIPVAGTAAQAGFDNQVLGVAPAICTAVPNNVAFVFGNAVAHEFVPLLCWTVVHEFAHLIGVEHEGLPQDPMSYSEGCYVKRFSPVPSACGTGPGDVQPCACQGGLQSSFTLLHERLGAAPGLLFGDAFEELDVDETLGSTCHWDQVEGEEAPPPFADFAPVTPFCATDHSRLLRKP